MEELIPKRKKRRNHKITLQLPFPINLNNGQSSSHPPIFMALGKYNGYSVVVENSVHITALYKNGFYGKGLLSRSAPRIIRNEDPNFRYIRNRQYKCRLFWKDSSSSSTFKHKLEEVSRNVHRAMTSAGLFNESIEAFLEDSDSEDEVELITVVPDSETDNDDETEQIEFVQKPDPYPTTEPLYLLLEEAFFMMYGLCCLRITDLNKQNLSIKEAWDCFRSGNDDFIHRYAGYHYFRSKGWVVKSGLKFGGDFLLYKDGPPFYHATYVVFLEVFYGLQRIESACTCDFTALNMLAANRCVETSAKGVLIAQLEYPENFKDNINQYTYEDIKNTVTVHEVLYLRWLPKKLASK